MQSIHDCNTNNNKMLEATQTSFDQGIINKWCFIFTESILQSSADVWNTAIYKNMDAPYNAE